MTFIQYPTLNIFKFETNPQDGSLEINSLCSLPADVCVVLVIPTSRGRKYSIGRLL